MPQDYLFYELSIKDLEPTISRFSKSDRAFERNFNPAMSKSVMITEALVKTKLLSSVFRGRLRNSIVSKVVVLPGSKIFGIVGSSLKEVYPQVVEHGRRPGRFPDIGELKTWVRLKLKVPAKKLDSVTYLIGRRIAKRGIKGKHFLARAYQTAKPAILRYHKDALDHYTKFLAGKGK